MFIQPVVALKQFLDATMHLTTLALVDPDSFRRNMNAVVVSFCRVMVPTMFGAQPISTWTARSDRLPSPLTEVVFGAVVPFVEVVAEDSFFPSFFPPFALCSYG